MSALKRLIAMILKESRQIRRDGLTMGMMFVIPIVQLVLFGYAINADPKTLPTAVLSYDNSPLSRAITRAIGATGYFSSARAVNSEAEADALMQAGEVQFIITIPDGFFRSIVRHEKAEIAVEADATDPSTVAPAIAAVNAAITQTLAAELTGPLASSRPAPQDVQVILQRRYNPEGLTRFNIVPGLLGIILTMTMVMQTALAVTREYERGTMENLLAMPVKPLEVMAGKILPYVLIGAVQVAVVLTASRILFNVPFLGAPWLFGVATLLFITVNLAIGFTFSTVARNQLQAVQMSIFFMLPSILLSGFAFPFRGMPGWAQALGSILPATHFIRISRGIMLKGATFAQMASEVSVLALMLVIVGAVAVSRYRVTLD
ncbi:MAG: ABC transporter permease [Alphaproteobacteria bacterium]|nr:ABC transporter permease [Alphaproteobacteria bacterium]